MANQQQNQNQRNQQQNQNQNPQKQAAPNREDQQGGQRHSGA